MVKSTVRFEAHFYTFCTLHEPAFRPRRRSRPRPRSDRLVSRTRTSRRTIWFLVPMHGIKVVGAFHEPLVAPTGFGLRQSSGALAMEASQPKAQEDWRSPRRYRAIRRFMAPMHAKKRKGAFHEPQGAAGILPAPFRLFEVYGPNARHQSRGSFP